MNVHNFSNCFLASVVSVALSVLPNEAQAMNQQVDAPAPDSGVAAGYIYDPAIDDDPTALPPALRPLAQVDVPVEKEPLKHKGFVLEAQGGTMGCTGAICSGSAGHRATPGPRVSGFVGGNIGGIVELGISGGFGKLQSSVQENRNALDIFGISVPDIPSEYLNGFDLNTLVVSSSQLDDFRAGPALRLHLVPRGRVQAFVGSGFGYHRFRGRYETASGPIALSFHGLDVPLEAGLGVYINKRVSVGVRFDYLWTHYAAVSIKHPQANMVAPLVLLENQLASRDQALTEHLPRFWAGALALRLTL